MKRMQSPIVHRHAPGKPVLSRFSQYRGYTALVLLACAVLGGCRVRRNDPVGASALRPDAKAAAEPKAARPSDSSSAGTPATNGLKEPTVPSAASGSSADDRTGAEAPEEALPEGVRIYAFAGGISVSHELKKKVRQRLAQGTSAEIAATIVREFENLESTNAGRGSALRLDGKTVECDALLLDSDGRMGRATHLQKSLEPILVAEALYRAGGASSAGASADALAERLGLSGGTLLTDSVRSAFPRALSRAMSSAQDPVDRLMYSLYLEPSLIAGALAGAAAPLSDLEKTLPVFALVFGTDGKSALAMSTGGIPLSRPGAPSLIDDHHQSPALSREGAVVVLPVATPCTQTSPSALLPLSDSDSFDLVTGVIEAQCPEARYLVVGKDRSHTNMNPASLLRWESGASSQENVDEDGQNPASAAHASPSETETGGAKTKPAARATPSGQLGTSPSSSGASETSQTAQPRAPSQGPKASQAASAVPSASPVPRPAPAPSPAPRPSPAPSSAPRPPVPGAQP